MQTMPQTKALQILKKHHLNFYPEATEEEMVELRDGIARNGYDPSQPVVTYWGAILDGWNRQKACIDLGVGPTYREFHGTDDEALEYVIGTNRRRDLNKGQRAMLAVRAGELRAELTRVANKGGRPKSAKPTQKIGEVSHYLPGSDRHKRETDQLLGKAFGVNRSYVNQATKLATAAPEVAAKVEAGTMTLQDGLKEARKKPTNPWMDDERKRRKLVEGGSSVVANAERDKNLIQWAESERLAVRIDRGTLYGNPFIVGKDGDRDAVCDNYRDHYLPFKPSIRRDDLCGKVLICHCYPERCHGDSLITIQ